MKFNIISYSFLGKTGDFDAEIVGGQEIYLMDLSKFLVKKGHEVTIIQAGPRGEEEIEDIKVKKIGDVGKNEFAFRWKKYLDKKADFVHFHDFEHAFPLAKDSYTGTCHGVTWDCPEPNLYWKVHNIYHKFLAKYAVKRLKKIASVDSFLLRFVQSEMPNYRDKVTVIHSYVDTKIFRPSICKSVRKNFSRPIILFPRNLTYIRGIMLILKSVKEVIKRIPSATLLVTGTGPLEKEAKEYVMKNGLEKNVFFLGHKDHYTEMPRFYAASDLVVVPSLGREGCSLSALEALATKKPLVVTNVGGLIDIVIHGFNGLVSKPNYKDLSEKILYLIENKKEAKRVAQTGYVWVKKYFNYKVWCKKYEEFFEI